MVGNDQIVAPGSGASGFAEEIQSGQDSGTAATANHSQYAEFTGKFAGISPIEET